MLRIATVNVNGIRAARRRGMGEWVHARRADGRGVDVFCLQEVRATGAQLRAELAGCGLGDHHVVHAEAQTAGRAGVAVVSATPLLGGEHLAAEFEGSGRWVEAELDPAVTGDLALTVVSVYVHTGQAGTDRQDEKMRFLSAVRARCRQLRATGREVVVCGDLNIAHREDDLKNWRGNRTTSGFLPQERALIDDWFDPGGDGFVDVQRALAGPGPGPYSWWSWRGKAFDNDAGWRIDYQVATPPVARAAVAAVTDRAATYAQRWSDHAPVVCDYEL